MKNVILTLLLAVLGTGFSLANTQDSEVEKEVIKVEKINLENQEFIVLYKTKKRIATCTVYLENADGSYTFSTVTANCFLCGPERAYARACRLAQKQMHEYLSK